jgi:predicted dehydrogenase
MSLTRRRFLSTAAAAAAAPYVLSSLAPGAPAPSKRVALGFIGIGKQGEYHLRSLVRNRDFQVVGIAEVYKQFRDLGTQIVDEEYKPAAGSGCRGHVDYREMLARRDVDAVLIATPDHWHAAPTIHACRAGKDVYCEKPLTLTIREGREMVNAVRRFGRVLQTGSMQRSSREFWTAAMLVRNGYIGDVKTVHVNVGGPSRPCDLPEEPVPEGLEWDMWLGPAPVRPFNAVLRPPHNNNFPNWRSYREYSGGGMTDWGAHHFDIAQWGLGMDESGPVEIHPPGTLHPKNLTFKYANGILMYHAGKTDEGDNVDGLLFTGTKGKVMVNRGKITTTPEELAKTDLAGAREKLYRSVNHHGDWLECMHTRRKPICDVEIGCRSVTVCHLGNIAYWLKRSLKWDPKKEDFIGDADASRWLDRPKRAPYTI